MVHQSEISINTNRNGDMHCLDVQVDAIVQESGIDKGIVHVFNVGSTACVGTVEFEPGLQKDIPELLNKIAPPSRSYGHELTWNDGNGHSHLQATLMGPSLTVPVQNGQTVRGTWQQIFHLECDIKPRTRTIVVTVIGE